MNAQAGDWLLVRSRSEATRSRRGLILEVKSADGGPPFRVRWEDNGHETLVFPGPDSVVISAMQQQRAEEDAVLRAERAQNLIGATHRPTHRAS